MKTLLRISLLVAVLMTACGVRAQKTEYIIKQVKGSVEYKMRQADEWKPAKRLLSIPRSSIVRIADGAGMTIYSQNNPQILRIDVPGENRLRTLIDEAEKSAAKSRGGELAHVLKGHGGQGQTMRSGTSYRGFSSSTLLAQIAEALKNPAAPGRAPLALTLVKDLDGDYGVELANSGNSPLVVTVLVNVNGRYTPLGISGDSSATGSLLLPAGAVLTVPECSLADIPDMKAVAVATEEPFDPATLCTLLNSPAGSEDLVISGQGNITVVAAAVR